MNEAMVVDDLPPPRNHTTNTPVFTPSHPQLYIPQNPKSTQVRGGWPGGSDGRQNRSNGSILKGRSLELDFGPVATLRCRQGCPN